ncbi:MAG: hypothetical protein WA667_28535 [Candidatus Nitrosopolaris sp.]
MGDGERVNQQIKLGEIWSIYFKTVLESIFNGILGKHIDTSISKTTLAFKFEG